MTACTTKLLTSTQRRTLVSALSDRLIAVCFGAGVDSTAMLVALHLAGIRPDVITFADTGAEKPETLIHLDRTNIILGSWGWPSVTVCRKIPLPSTGYSDLYSNCIANETLPSLAFGMKSCSIKWKQGPQDRVLKGSRSGPNAAAPHPVWLKAEQIGQRIVKLIGYDCDRADIRRSRKLTSADADFDYVYPLQLIGWGRGDCIRAITTMLGPDYVPIKSACFFCPASKQWELFWLAAEHSDLFERALFLERKALTGRHSLFDAVEFGVSWDDMVRNADRFPSSNTTVGLGRSFAWNQWARVQGVVDDRFRVRRGKHHRSRFLKQAARLRDGPSQGEEKGAGKGWSDRIERAFGQAALSLLSAGTVMNLIPSTIRSATALKPDPRGDHYAQKILVAALALLPLIETGQAVGSSDLRKIMTSAFGNSDAEGAWVWKDAYDACEAAQVLFLRKYGRSIIGKSAAPHSAVGMLEKVAALLPTHTRRTDESQALQQLSTPLPLAFAAAHAAQITAGDLVLEPSAGTGMLAVFASVNKASLVLNEVAEGRAGLLQCLFPSNSVTMHDAAHIDDYLDATLQPTVVVMNPPFSAGLHIEGRIADAAWRHLTSAFARLAPGGRLVAITGSALSPDSGKWRDAFLGLQHQGTLVFSAVIDGRLYARHGTTTETRLTVIDKRPAADPSAIMTPRGLAADVATLFAWLSDLPARAKPEPEPEPEVAVLSASSARNHQVGSKTQKSQSPKPAIADEAAELVYELLELDSQQQSKLGADGVYEPYRLQSIHIPNARPHPDRLVESMAMASVTPPKPNYRPHLPASIVASGTLSDAQLESVIYAGQAHSGHLSGTWLVDASFDNLKAAKDNEQDAVCFRRGWFLGDGTGAGKGRQVAGIILDNWLKGRRRHVWISKSDKLIEDAQRDWRALGQEKLLVTPLSRFRQGRPIQLQEGILFVTFATLRSDEREGKRSRVQQIVDWLGSDFEGVIVFDEGHTMANAAGGKSERGDKAASQQGRAGLRLQRALPDARVVYVSATGATDVESLAYAERLGLWGGSDFPFPTRSEFIAAIEDGGVAAMEVLARDLKALGLYASRSLSFDGVEYDIVEHQLTKDQTRIYDAYAEAFQIIHSHLDAAMEASGITGASGTLNKNAKSAARSAFESSKQRFFNHLLISMKTPTLLGSIEADLAHGDAAIIQIVSTGEALTERRLVQIPTSEWSDIQVDVTPREYVLDYLMHSFPTQLFEEFSDTEGNRSSRPVYDDSGQPILCREAVRRRNALVERLGSLEAVPTALDQIVQHFGTDMVAEITGRSRRIVRKETGAISRYAVENRPGSANLDETRAFLDDEKRILVFSDAGGTGRSYHAELTARNQRLRVHYLLEAGWRADVAIQGLGRSHRTNQRQPPLFRPVATNVKAERRFLSTIARRLDTLGAITRGQRQTGGQGMFRSEDNLESQYARDALRQFYGLLYAGRIKGCSLSRFETATGLSLTSEEGGLKDELPPIQTFLNRMLALTIVMQNLLFDAFEQLLTARIEGAIASGTYDKGLETITADSMVLKDRQIIYTHANGAQSHLLTIDEKRRNRPMVLSEAEAIAAQDPRAQLMVNGKSGRAAVMVPSRSIMLEDGTIEPRVSLIRPLDELRFELRQLEETNWEEADDAAFAKAWTAEVDALPEFSVSTLHIVSGLLLPIWRQLPQDYCRVYRLETDEGERIVGRVIAPSMIGTLCRNLGVDRAQTVSSDQAWASVVDGSSVALLAGDLSLRWVRVMNDNRIELTGFSEGMRDWLKSIGLFAEIINWKTRMFVPVNDDGPTILGRLIERYRLIELTSRHEGGR